MTVPCLHKGSLSTDLIPLCCHCHRERTVVGEWREHVPVAGERLTHSICPECIAVLYPELESAVRAQC